MATRDISFQLYRADLVTPCRGSVMATPTRRHNSGTMTVLPTAVQIAVNGVTVHALEVPGADWCWEFRERVNGGATRYCTFVAGSEINYQDLDDIDPLTFDPVAESLAGWTAAVASTAANVTAAAASAATAVAATVNKVDKGALVFNVKDYGAVGNWSTGTTGTVDTTAINLALTAAAGALAANPVATARVLVPGTTGNGYIIDDTITTPSGVEWDIRSPLVYTGPTGRAALVIGGSTAQFHRKHVIRLKRYALSTWLDEADAGVVIRNHYSSEFTIAQCDNFTVGVTCIGDTIIGFSYNKVHLGALIDNKIAVDLTNDTVGWCNQNDFYGGRFAVSSGTWTSLDRVGVRITSRATSKYYNNANTFYAPSFEVKGAAIVGVGTCMLVEYGSTNRTIAARHESNSPGVLVQQNNSTNNWMDFAYTDEGANAPIAVLSGAASSGGITRDFTSMTDRAMRVIYKADSIHKRACYYDGGTAINVPGLTVGTSGSTNTDARAASTLVLNADYLEITSGRYVGFYMSTRTMKQFAVLRDCESGFGGRILIRAYDAAGTVLSAAGTVQTAVVASNPTYGTAYCGAFKTGVDNTVPMNFGVSAATDYVFVGVTGGTAVARLRALSVATHGADNPAVWLAFPDEGKNYGTVAPTSGTWAVGREVVNAVPAAAQPSKWVCSVAGTPGTWIPVTGASGGSFTAMDVQVFTASGTWTMPAGAASVQVRVQAPGGGGGSGRRGAAASIRCGGGGGSGGSFSTVEIPAAALTGTVAVTIGAAGAGGAAVTVDDTNGNAGTAGATTQFGTYCRASGGAAGTGGTNALGTGGAAVAGMFTSGPGGAASTTGLVGGVGGSPAAAPAGGGAGGGVSAADAESAGGNGGFVAAFGSTSAPTGGVVTGGAGTVGGSAATGSALPGQGGAGGGSSKTTAGGAGGAGGNYGAGAGGGGASLNGFASGAGGAGAPAVVVVITRF